jgi:hypothetical protein
MDAKQEQEWIARCAYRLRQRWRTVDTHSLEEVAQELVRDGDLQRLAPDAAAAAWLARGALSTKPLEP